MIDTQAELIRLLEYMDKHMSHSLWGGIILEGGNAVIAFGLN